MWRDPYRRDENRLLSGAKFELFADAGCTEHISGYEYPNGQPAADGVYYPDIPVPAAGSVQYYVKEVQAPENYLLAAGRVFVVTVDAEGKLGFSEKVLENGALRKLNADEEAYLVSSTNIAIKIANEPNVTEFEFNKKWLFNGEKQEWPKEVKSITVTLTRTCKAGSGDAAQGETEAGGATQGSAQREISQSVTFTVTPQMKSAIDLKKITGSQISGTVSLVSTAENVYSYKITGLEDTAFGSTQGGSGPKWEYSISEATVDGYNAPKYVKKGDANPTDGAASVGDGGTILNDKITITLPHTGGFGTRPYTFGGIILIMAAALSCGFRMRRRV